MPAAGERGLTCYGRTLVTDWAAYALFEREVFSDLPVTENTNMQEMHLSLSILLLFINGIELKN